MTIPLHPSLHAVLAETPRGDRRGAVMPQTAALYEWDTATLAARTRLVFESCGIETRDRSGGGRAKVEVGFHSLRHTFVSMSANAGAPLAVVQSLVGHSTPAMTMHYYHGTTDAARAAVNALPPLLGGNAAWRPCARLRVGWRTRNSPRRRSASSGCAARGRGLPGVLLRGRPHLPMPWKRGRTAKPKRGVCGKTPQGA